MNNYEDIKRLQPSAVRNIKDFDIIAKGQSKAFEKIESRVDKLYNNSFLISLEFDGIERWEKIYNFEPSGSYETRRNTIIAYKRGKGKLNSKTIKNMAIAYENGEVEVWFDKESLKLKIKFISQYGVPNGLEKLKEILEQLKPARLIIDYLFNYLLIKDIHNVMEVKELENTILNKFAF